MGQELKKETGGIAADSPHITGYLDHERRQGANSLTLKTYRMQLGKLVLYLEEQGLEISSLTPAGARGFKFFLNQWVTRTGGPLSASSRQGTFCRARRFYEYLTERKLIPGNPFSGMKNPRGEMKLPRKPLNEKQMEEFLTYLKYWWDEQVPLLSAMGRYMSHVQSELMYSSGLRAAEAAALTENDIDLEKGEVRVRGGKGGKERLAFISSYACDILRIYLKELRPLILRGHTRKSPTIFGVGETQYKYRLNLYLKEAYQRNNFPRQTSHSFRHAFGAHLLRSGCDIRKIQGLLGHGRLHTTQVYTKLEKEDLKEVLNQYHPRKPEASWTTL